MLLWQRLVFSPSAIGVGHDSFLINWETGVWPITPFIDPGLIGVAMGMPRSLGSTPSKQEIFRMRTDIFITEQFRQKQGAEEHVGRYLTERPKVVLSILKNSRLGEKGWIKAEEIVHDIKKGKVEEYFEGDAMSFLLNVLELEYFLQTNNIKVN